MSADYQALMLLSISCSFILYELVFRPNVSMPKLYFDLMLVSVILVVCGLRYLEIPSNQIAVLVVSFTGFAGIYAALAECVLKEYLQAPVMRWAYVSHIGIWSGLLAWSTRWLF